ncbi:TetR/AcrR family transcriptional regulator [Lacisediminimonas profundi]|uniref:TetR/AcrR family transcriptional regulator n=1 Tax=Lacisediminimonas profundi TaxID=2603856 RepID=UPI0013873B51|nr:TetR/AcrR family transcriptional regulator [Lacisediminimonas profundi]
MNMPDMTDMTDMADTGEDAAPDAPEPCDECGHAPHSKAAERALAQRERILIAAKACFIRHGFHAASMAIIAGAAAMSPGLIYRYFPSKSAIILAIIEGQLEEARAGIRTLYGAADFADAALQTFTHWRNADPQVMNAALLLEISAEATRDPALSAAVQASDVAVREELSHWLSASLADGGKGLAPEVAPQRALSLQLFMEGIAIRALREPDIDPATLKAAIDHFVADLFAA